LLEYLLASQHGVIALAKELGMSVLLKERDGVFDVKPHTSLEKIVSEVRILADGQDRPIMFRWNGTVQVVYPGMKESFDTAIVDRYPYGVDGRTISVDLKEITNAIQAAYYNAWLNKKQVQFKVGRKVTISISPASDRYRILTEAERAVKRDIISVIGP
jgi:hypothetical protein